MIMLKMSIMYANDDGVILFRYAFFVVCESLSFLRIWICYNVYRLEVSVLLSSLLEEKLKNSDCKILDRLNTELEIIRKYNKEDFILNLIKLSGILKSTFGSCYSITGAVNDLFILYLLNVTEFNPLDYNQEVSDSFRVNINIPVGKRNLFFLRIRGEFDGNVLEDDRYLIISPKEISNISRKDDIHNVNNIIYFSEKRVLSILSEIVYNNDFVLLYNDENKLKISNLVKNSKCLHKSVYEEIMEDKSLYESIGFRYLSEMSNEFKLTYIKYVYPTKYYSAILKYLSCLVNIDVVKKFGSDVSKVLKYYDNLNRVKEVDDITYDFYKIFKDAKRVLGRIDFEVKEDDIQFKFYNIVFMESRVRTVTEMISNIIIDNMEKRVKLFIYDGPSEWYTRNVIGKYMNLDRLEMNNFRLVMNPFMSYKYDFTFDYDKYIQALDIFRHSHISFYSCACDDYDWSKDLLRYSNHNTDMVIIDNFEYMRNNSRKSLGKLLEELNNLSIPVIIFEYPKNKYSLNKKVVKRDVKLFDRKNKWVRAFYGVSSKDDKLFVKKVV